MDKKWTLHVENFAKIKTADVQISPLICFVGDNNSGKSYLMSLLWGILTLGKEIFPKSPSDSKTYKKLTDPIKTKAKKGAESVATYAKNKASKAATHVKDATKPVTTFVKDKASKAAGSAKNMADNAMKG